MTHFQTWAKAELNMTFPEGMSEQEMLRKGMEGVCAREDARRAAAPPVAKCSVRSSQPGSCGM